MNEKFYYFIRDSARGYLFVIIWMAISLGAYFLFPKLGKFTLPLEVIYLLFLGFIVDRIIKLIYKKNENTKNNSLDN